MQRHQGTRPYVMYSRNAPMEREILTIEEAADLLQIGKRSLYKLAKEGKIPGKKLLNKWRFERESLKAWVRDDGKRRNIALGRRASRSR